MGFNGHTADGGDGVGDITMCYNMSQLLGSSGGICGYFANLTGLGKAISNSFNAGSTTYAIYSDSEYNPIVTNCYYSLGQNLGSYATATNEENFKSATWLANTLHWDMENVWQISPHINNGYPTLRQGLKSKTKFENKKDIRTNIFFLFYACG